ncbi:hypothetical protein ATY81_00785 [Rhizobium sp. R72]|uniref:hypothetical protein n=1 Tax=unclassified Rhizobium TaxID=2613769 RepID=UPI000B719E91|nr:MULTISPECIES: hypothetical protein [unclassified Rhizobium]OWW04560.1 hypothetical protein ATY81_00785 [Rhizobium sp. R72]OWW05617.1 hypothetical protein ATY80_00785 [Rhizobium sp. R711]
MAAFYIRWDHHGRDGELAKPITIEGSLGSVIKGGGRSRVIEINHTNIELRNFAVNGQFEKPNMKKSYRDRLLYDREHSWEGFDGIARARDVIRNAGGECVHQRSSRKNEIANSRISSCGRFDFLFNESAQK